MRSTALRSLLVTLLGASPLAVAAAGCGDTTPAMPADGCTSRISASADASANRMRLQAALAGAHKGSVVCLGAGTYPLNEEVTLATDNVEVRGAGMMDTVLDFAGQSKGVNGLSVTQANNFKLSKLTVKNVHGDAVRVTQATGVTFREVRVTWDGGPKETNGPYGLYPVESTNVLIDKCVVSYASDAGIYVGQSKNVLIRDSEAFGNVAGIEFENTTDAEAVNNYAHDNTGGVLVFDLPDLKVQGGKRAKVHHNRIVNNNGDNFAAKSGIVSVVPSGIGLMIMASHDNEAFDNDITNNRSTGVAVVSYFVTSRSTMDMSYDPYPEGNSVHDNRISGNGKEPMGLAGQIAAGLGLQMVEDMIWDGITNDKKPNTDGKLTNCFKGNGSATFRNLGLIDSTHFHTSTDITPFLCTHDALPSITLP